MSAPCYPGQPGDPSGDPQMDLSLLALHDGFSSLALAALAADTDEAHRVDGLLADVDIIAFGFPERSSEARILSQAASIIRELAVSP